MKKPIIQFENFSFQYQAQTEPTLKNVNLTIYEGEKVLIVGPSGSGKSTLGQCLNGIIPTIYHGEMSGNLWIKASLRLVAAFMTCPILSVPSCKIRTDSLSD